MRGIIDEEDVDATCNVCWESESDEKLLSCSKCAGTTCHSCVTSMVTVYVDRGAIDVQCPTAGCKRQLSVFEVNEYAKLDETVAAKLTKNRTDFDVNSSRWKKYCHACGDIATAAHRFASAKCASTSCNARTCLSCGAKSHHLKSCNKFSTNAFKSWTHMRDVKRCPQCSIYIEKNAGCNHMTCRNGFCMHEFCWICNGVWTAHDTSRCGAVRRKQKFSDKYYKPIPHALKPVAVVAAIGVSPVILAGGVVYVVGKGIGYFTINIADKVAETVQRLRKEKLLARELALRQRNAARLLAAFDEASIACIQLHFKVRETTSSGTDGSRPMLINPDDISSRIAAILQDNVGMMLKSANDSPPGYINHRRSVDIAVGKRIDLTHSWGTDTRSPRPRFFDSNAPKVTLIIVPGDPDDVEVGKFNLEPPVSPNPSVAVSISQVTSSASNIIKFVESVIPLVATV